ncbi:hypothetical protein E1288_34335 [Saccharopolyspora elongata]|uniref:Uncharacterized protein n=1 Tax=Saccharopolyspora elongata TaxID=2530387 RepID=A0A4R4YAR1_9PSEU|nr:hypothetical protein E1288_34335 [Saccharopolyspora elongata]
MRSSTTSDVCFRVSAPSAYGDVAPLVLTMPEEEPSPCPHVAEGMPGCTQPTEEDLRALRHAAHGGQPSVLQAPLDLVERIRYRWMVGHHAAFGVWQLQTRCLQAIADSPAPTTDDVHTAARLFDAYSLLFLYTGSCSAEHYAATVRAEMMACNAAFSGKWARDYEPVMLALRGIRNKHPESVIAPLTSAAKRNHRLHMAVAKKLVPNGASLLREAGHHPGHAPTGAERDVFDAFFQVQRRTLCRRAFAAQLVRRFAQVMCDIAAHRLSDPASAPARQDAIPAPRDAALRDAFEQFEEDAGDLLLRISEIVISQQVSLPRQRR